MLENATRVGAVGDDIGGRRRVGHVPDGRPGRFAPYLVVATNAICASIASVRNRDEYRLQRCEIAWGYARTGRATMRRRGGEFSDLVAELKNLPPLSPPRRWGKWPVANLEDAAKRV